MINEIDVLLYLDERREDVITTRDVMKHFEMDKATVLFDILREKNWIQVTGNDPGRCIITANGIEKLRQRQQHDQVVRWLQIAALLSLLALIHQVLF